MSKEQGTFERYEKKYMVSESKYRLLREKLEGKLVVDSFGKSTICNIYFDTPNHRLIRDSIEKPVYKEKLRVRSYGVPEVGDMVFIELKKKYDGVVFKRRVKMELTEAENYLYDGGKVSEESQITKEIDWFLKYYQEIIPSMYISYNRIAMYGVEDSSVRVTFDSNILWRKDELYLESGIWGEELLEPGSRLMEIKILGAMPMWLSQILDELEIFPVSYSKYGKAYQTSEQYNLNLQKENEVIDNNFKNEGVIKYA